MNNQRQPARPAFARATKKDAKLRLALIGPSGSGKTYTALRVARGIGGRVAVIDTEKGSASKYAESFEFDALDLETHAPADYVRAIEAAEREGYDVLVIDSLSHAWMGRGGALEMVDAQAAKERGNSFGAWRTVTPEHNNLVDALIRCRCHLIVTMRSKTEWVIEKDDRGKTVPKKIGTAPVQRDGLEYEFDVVADIDLDNRLIISKTRCSDLHNKTFVRAGEELGVTLRGWLSVGPKVDGPKLEVVAPPATAQAPAQAPAPATAPAQATPKAEEKQKAAPKPGSFSALLAEIGATGEEAQAALKALTGSYDLRNASREDKERVLHDLRESRAAAKALLKEAREPGQEG